MAVPSVEAAASRNRVDAVFSYIQTLRRRTRKRRREA